MKHQIDRLEIMLKDYQDLQKTWIDNSDCPSPGYYERVYRGLEEEKLEIKTIIQSLKDLFEENQELKKKAADFEGRWLVERQINMSNISGGRYSDGYKAW